MRSLHPDEFRAHSEANAREEGSLDGLKSRLENRHNKERRSASKHKAAVKKAVVQHLENDKEARLAKADADMRAQIAQAMAEKDVALHEVKSDSAAREAWAEKKPGPESDILRIEAAPVVDDEGGKAAMLELQTTANKDPGASSRRRHEGAKKGIIDKVKALLKRGGRIGGHRRRHRKGRRHRHRHPSAHTTTPRPYDATLDVATAVYDTIGGFAEKKMKKKKATKTVARPVKKGGVAPGGQCEDYTDLNITPEDAALGAELCSKRCCGDSFDLPGKCWINGKVLAFPVRPCCTLKCPKKLKLKDLPPYTFDKLTKKEIASGAAICAKKCSGSDYPEPIATCFLCGEELTYPNIVTHKLECDKLDTEKHKGVKTEEITLEEAKKGVKLCKKKCCGATFLGKCRIDDDEFTYECVGGPDWKPASTTIVLPRGALDDPHKPCPECTQKVNVTVPCDGRLPCPCKPTDPPRPGFSCLKGSGKSRAVVASTSNSS